MKDIAEYRKYKIITLPDQHGINCIFLNNALLHCAQEEHHTNSKVVSNDSN